jgi:hypothetical protein
MPKDPAAPTAGSFGWNDDQAILILRTADGSTT